MSYNIAVVGTGYVGLVTGVCLAETGNQVVCVDIDPAKIEMLEAGAEVVAYDPEAIEPARRRYGNRVRYGTSTYETVRDADALVILTEWNEFRNPDLDRIAASLKEPVVFDGRNLLESEDLVARGFKYYSVGRAIDTDRVPS